MILAFLAVILVGVLPSLLAILFYKPDRDYGKRFTTTEQLIQRYLGAVTSIAVVLLAAQSQPGGIPLLGLGAKNGVSNLAAVVIGTVAFVLSLYIYYAGVNILVRGTKVQMVSDTSRPDIANLLQYQNIWERLALLTELTVGVIAEDLIYRGYLVLLLGKITGSFVPWIVLSLVLSVIIHLYQGRNLATGLWHVIWAALFIGLAIYTQNLLTTIAAHLYYDIVWAIQTWKRSDQEAQAETAVPLSRAKKAAYMVFVGANVLGAIFVVSLLF